MTVNGLGPVVPPIPPMAPQAAPAVRGGAEAMQGAAEPQRPEHANPALWSVLTADEQHFFSEQSLVGPLTYGPARGPVAPEAPRGQRIDVRA